MKKVLVLLAMVLGTTNMYAQDYDLQRLAKVCEKHPNLVQFSDGLCGYFDFDEGCVFFNKLGERVVVIHYAVEPFFCDGLILVGGGDNEVTMGKYGYADKSGKIVIPYQYDYASHFNKGKAEVSKDGRTFYIDIKGKEIDNDKLSDSAELLNGSLSAGNESGLIMVENNGKYGWKNEKGDIVIPIIFENAVDNFSDGLAWVILNGAVGFVDKYGNSTFNPSTTNNQNVSQEVVDNVDVNASFVGGTEATEEERGKVDDPITEEQSKLYSEALAQAYKYLDAANNNTDNEAAYKDYIKKADDCFKIIQSKRNSEQMYNPEAIKFYRSQIREALNSSNRIKFEVPSQLETEIRILHEKASNCIDKANNSKSKDEIIKYVKQADEYYVKILNIPNFESVIPAEYVNGYREKLKQMLDMINQMK